MTSVNAFATLLEAFFNIFLQTHTHRHEDITLPLLRMRARGSKTLSVEHLCYAHLIAYALCSHDLSLNLHVHDTFDGTAFPSSCNIQLQEWEQCHPIKLQKDLNSALWLAHTVDTVATGSCKNLEKRCSVLLQVAQ